MSGKVRPRVPFSSVTLGRRHSWALGSLEMACVEGRCSLRKPWFCTRYSAIECLPAQMLPQMPINMVEVLSKSPESDHYCDRDLAGLRQASCVRD